jgi:hypothetical protein
VLVTGNIGLFVSGGRDGQLLLWDTRVKTDPEMVNNEENLVSDITGTVIEQGKEGNE